jgi:thiosulfate/3-mercaptopyruvate sulfurtransferase
MPAKSPFVVSPEWLAARLGNIDVSIVDASWYLPDQKREAKAEYAASHIPGAVFFDIDANSDKSSPLPHMLPSESEFSNIASGLGISADNTIVVYDGAGLFSAARVWWTFRTFGAKHVFILDGGLPAWLATELPVTNEVTVQEKKQFKAKLDAGKVKNRAEMLALVNAGNTTIADARSAGRFAATMPEPRAGLRGGHMPGANSLPFNMLIENGHLKDITALEDAFKAHHIDLNREIVTTCGSGVTAAVISLALESIGHKDHALYDGSWSEWGLPGETPVVLGGVEPLKRKLVPRYLTAHITELEMNTRPALREPLPIGHKISLLKTSGMAPSFYRYLYQEVGKPHHWFIRRNLPDSQLASILTSGKAEIWVLYVDGCPAGFYEIEIAGLPDNADIQYFGLLPPYQGRGLSKFMLSEAINAAWDKNPKTVTIQTNTLDSPKALAIYQKAGFSPVGTYDELIEAWD